MGQLNFEQNFLFSPVGSNPRVISDGSMWFWGQNIQDSISLLTANLICQFSQNLAQTKSFSLGLYSVNGSTLSLANSLSRTFSTNNGNGISRFISLSAVSSAQNITPGTWFWGLLGRTAGASNFSIYGRNSNLAAFNAFPGSFIGGSATVSTNALPATVATSDLDITGDVEMFEPYILLTAV